MIPVVLIPAKDPSRAKLRLSSCLNQEQRAALVRSMWIDLADSLSGIACPVAVVTDSREIEERAVALGWRVIDDTRGVSESDAVDRASRILQDDGFDTVLRLPADVPLTRKQDIEALLASSARVPFARLVPSRSRTGTNAMLRNPPLLFPSRFGPDSLLLHVQECRRAGTEPEIVELPNIGLDIDEPDDLEAFLRVGAGTATHHWLRRSGLQFRHREE